MSDTIDKATSVIKDRLTELDDERKRLEKALSALTGDAVRKVRDPGKPKASKPKAKRTRAKRGEREAQLLSSIQRHPDYKPADHAREIGVSPGQIYGLISKMTTTGLIRKTPKGALRVKNAS